LQYYGENSYPFSTQVKETLRHIHTNKLYNIIFRATTHLSGKAGNVRDFDACREMSGKKSCRGKMAKNCVSLVANMRPYGYLVVPLNVDRSAGRQGIFGAFYSV